MLDLIILKKYGKRVMSGLSIEGMENLKKADAQGKGVIVITSHLGAFSIGASVMARLGKPITPIGFHPDTTTIPRYSWTLMLYAQSLGCDQENPIIFVGQDTIERVREHLRKGRRVGIAYDVMGNFVVDFLGRPTALASGVAYFACDIGSPVIPICLLRGRKPLEFRLIIGEPLCYRPSDDRSSKVNTITCEVAKAGEDLIREAPGQWMSWFGLSEWRDKARELEEQKA
jgi:KDO2-lipid IV(A) lauroyltransferase